MHTVYIIKSEKTGKHYIGHTRTLSTRLMQHNRGRVHSTRNGRPWTLIHTESFLSKTDAYKREMQIKKYKGGKAFTTLLKKEESRVDTKVVNWDRL
ncbi:MAG: GIY-YIG nuclease family protein [Patescibacteria group bacterium]|nr:GIY-YIG nuclease family protein [Patescibacteria group bacterium]MDD5716060.1 GIY-YIG nuclease family protein [Patescibacteria group bacterium]